MTPLVATLPEWLQQPFETAKPLLDTHIEEANLVDSEPADDPSTIECLQTDTDVEVDYGFGNILRGNLLHCDLALVSIIRNTVLPQIEQRLGHKVTHRKFCDFWAWFWFGVAYEQ